MTKRPDPNRRRVWSTDAGPICPRCLRATSDCRCREEVSAALEESADGRHAVRLLLGGAAEGSPVFPNEIVDGFIAVLAHGWLLLMLEVALAAGIA